MHIHTSQIKKKQLFRWRGHDSNQGVSGTFFSSQNAHAQIDLQAVRNQARKIDWISRPYVSEHLSRLTPLLEMGHILFECYGICIEHSRSFIYFLWVLWRSTREDVIFVKSSLTGLNITQS